MSNSLQPHGLFVAQQTPLSMGFSGQEYWSGLPCPPLGDLPHLEIEPVSLMLLALASGFFTHSAPWEALQGGDLVKERETFTVIGTTVVPRQKISGV